MNTSTRAINYSMLPESFFTTHEVVLIDDDEISHFLFKGLIKMHKPDLQVKTFSRPLEVIDLIVRNCFHTTAIVLDINMPLMNGWEFLKEIERLNYDIPVYMLSSSDDVKDIIRAKESKNVIDYFVKPFTVTHLKTILDIHHSEKN